MKTGKLALLATLTAALAFGGLPSANAVATAPAIPPEVQNPLDIPATAEALPEGTAVPAQDPTGAALPEATDPAHIPAPSEAASPVTEPGPAAVMAEPAEIPEAEDDGYVYVPVGEGHVVPGPDTPLVTEEDGSVRSVVESEHEHVEPMLARGGAASMLSAPSRAGNIKVTLVRATVNGNGNLVSLPSARNSITSANNYWRSMSNGRLSMSIASERVHYSSTANASDDYAVMMNKIAKELKWVDNPYTALVVFVPTADLRSGGYGGILGGGWTVGGTAGRILMPAPSSFTNNVVTHEVGHVLGLLHANSLQCTNGRQDVGSGNGGRWADGACSSREYGDTTDLMGSAQYNQPVINSYFWDAGSFGRGNEITDAGRAGTPRTYTLRPWGGTAANRAVKFTDPQSGDTYYIELRQPAGYDQYLQSGPSGNRGVKIVKADKANSWAVNSLIIPPSTRPFAGYYNGNHAWQAGQTFTTHTGTAVRINSVSASSASVTVSALPSIPSAADVVAVAPSGDLMHYPANTKGGFSSPRRIGVGWSGMVSTHAADWNGDGVIDVVAQTASGALLLYSGLPSGGFRHPVTIGNGWSGFRITVGKWAAGDKLPGVIAADSRGRTYLYRNLSGGYPSGRTLISTGTVPRLFAVADLNGNGVPELISILDDGKLVSQARNSSGTAGPAARIGVGWGAATSLVSVSGFNGTSTRGLLATFRDGRLAYYASDNRGSLYSSWTAGVGWNGYTLLNSQRLKDSGPPITSEADVVTLTGSTLHRSTVDLKGKLGAPTRIGVGFHSVESFHSVDWNGDGINDVLVQWKNGVLSVYHGRHQGSFGAPITVGVGWQGLQVIVDRPRTGLPGVLAIDKAGNLRRYTNANGVSMLRGGAIIGVGWSNLRVHVLDWDGDRSSDVLAATPTGELLFYRRDANGSFIQQGRTIGTGWNVMTDIAVGMDISADGRPSLVARNSKGALLNYPVLGNGRWGAAKAFSGSIGAGRIAGAN